MNGLNFMHLLKVSWFRNVFLVSSNLPPKKTNEKIRLYYYGTSSQIAYIRFLNELRTLKRHFEINWPLAAFSNFSLFDIHNSNKGSVL